MKNDKDTSFVLSFQFENSDVEEQAILNGLLERAKGHK